MKWNLILLSSTTILLSGCYFNAGLELDDDGKEKRTSYRKRPPEHHKVNYNELFSD